MTNDKTRNTILARRQRFVAALATAATSVVLLGCPKKPDPPPLSCLTPVRPDDGAQAKLMALLRSEPSVDLSRFEVVRRAAMSHPSPGLIAGRFVFFDLTEQIPNAKPGQHPRRLVGAVDLESAAAWFRDPKGFEALARALGLPSKAGPTAEQILIAWYELTKGVLCTIAAEADGPAAEEIKNLVKPPTKELEADGSLVVEGWTHTEAGRFQDKVRHTLRIHADGRVETHSVAAEELTTR